MKGRVISAKLTKTATVLVERIAKHALYKKTFIRSRKYLVDDAIGVKEGDIVEIINCKPVSKNKHWRVVKIVGKSLTEITEKKLKEAAEKTIAEVMPEEKETEEPKEMEKLKVKKEKPKKKGKKNGTA